MLEIKRTAPGLYTAMEAGEEVGRCAFEAKGDTTLVTGLSIGEGQDDQVLEGLVRAAVFCGLRQGRPFARLAPAVCARYGPQLEGLGLLLEQKTAVETLAGGCCGT